MTDDVCLEHQSAIKIAFGVILVVGAIAAYGPQWLTIYLRKSSFGFNFTTASINFVSLLLVAVNACILKYDTLECCTRDDVSVGQCLAVNLPWTQIVMPFLWMFVTVGLYIKYCMPEPPEFPVDTAQREAARAKAIVIGVLLLTLVLVMTTALMHWYFVLDNFVLKTWADVLGYTGAVFASIQYMPQFVQSYRLRRPGSLSIVTLLILLIGNAAVFIYQFFLSNTRFSAVFQNVCAVIQIGGLCSMLLYFRIVDGPTKTVIIRKQEIENEKSPLLIQ